MDSEPFTKAQAKLIDDMIKKENRALIERIKSNLPDGYDYDDDETGTAQRVIDDVTAVLTAIYEEIK